MLYLSSCFLVIIVGLTIYILYKRRVYRHLAHRELDEDQPHPDGDDNNAAAPTHARAARHSASIAVREALMPSQDAHRFDVEHGRPLHASDPSIVPPSASFRPTSSSNASMTSSRDQLTSEFERGARRKKQQPPIELKTFRSYN